VAGGAGFALAEGLLSGALSLDAEQVWLLAMVSRAGTVVIHCLAGGLMGLGWQALLSGRRRIRALGYYVAAVAAHGLWNGLVGGLAFMQLLGGAESEGLLGSWAEAAGVGLLGLLLVGLLGVQVLLLLGISGRLVSAEARFEEE
jgi:hypothetical protein